MEVKLFKKELVSALSKVVGILNPKPTLPVLNHILLETNKNHLIINGTDLEVSIKVTREVEGVLKEGKALIPGRKLAEIVREFPEAEIKLASEKENQVYLSCGRISLNLVGLKTEDFPLIPKIKNPVQFKVGTTTLKKNIGFTRSMVAYDENKPNISGMFFTTEDGWLTTVTTDTRRLAKYRSKTNLASNISFILPTKTADILKGLWEEEKEVEVMLGSNQAIFSAEGITLTSQIIEGKFPDYAAIIPKENELVAASIPTAGFVAALRRIKQVVFSGKNMVKLDFSPKGLNISGEAAGVGKGFEEMEISYNGPAKTFYFNPDYLIDGVKNLEGEEEFAFNLNANQEKPSVIKSLKQADYLYLIMPMWP